MLPKATAARWVYAVVTVICLALLVFSIRVTVWANSVEDGWISAGVTMICTWIVCGPLIPIPLFWSLALLAIRRQIRRENARTNAHQPKSIPDP
jgi:hypothetical protein